MPPPSTPSGGDQPGTGPNVGGGGNDTGTTTGVGGGAPDPQGQRTSRSPQEMIQDLEDQIDLFEAEVTSIRAQLREAKQNLRNAIRRNETDAVTIRDLNTEVQNLTIRLQAATGGMNGTRMVSAIGRLRDATTTLRIEKDMLAVANAGARLVNPFDVL